MSLTLDKFADWNARMALACRAIGQPEFPAQLTDCLNLLIDFQICMTFAYDKTDHVQCLDHNMLKPKADIVVQDYLQGPYLLDPFFYEVKRGRVEGCCVLSEISPDRFYSSEYFKHHYARTGIGDELGIFFPISEAQTAVISLTRPNRKHRFTLTERKRIRAVAPMVETAARQHYRTVSNTTLVRSVHMSTRKLIENGLEAFGEELLTPREAQIMSFVLKGHSSNSISSRLEISLGTVKIHRKNAYTKLCISSQAELFSIFLSSISST